ncbi:MAG TPA: galactokinase [bacterium]|nr:galactokinase [bacterium]
MSEETGANNKLSALQERFQQVYGQPKGTWVAVSAPGRVNLIGEHTDYNEGYVFPVAINTTVDVMAEAVSGNTVEIFAVGFDEKKTFSVNEREPHSTHCWVEYPRGVVILLRQRFSSISGMRMVIQGNVPLGAGLSSSAALEVATAFAVKELFGLDINLKDLALLCQKAEHLFAGVNCGIMDQFASALCEEGAALLLDCRNQETQAVPLPTNQFSLVIVNSMVKRGLVDSEYNTRRRECEQAVETLKRIYRKRKIHSLRDVTAEDWRQWKRDLSGKPQLRAQHVITENDRVLRCVQALKEGDMETFGTLLYEGHGSLKTDYEVTVRELDLLVGFARQSRLVWGARMTGAGFGGCVVNIAKRGTEDQLCALLAEEYNRATKTVPEFYRCEPSPGVRRIG